MLFYHPKILHKHCLQFLLGVKIASRETENNVLMERPRNSLSSGVPLACIALGRGMRRGLHARTNDFVILSDSSNRFCLAKNEMMSPLKN